MRYKQVKVDNTIISNPSQINKVLTMNNLSWLIDSEIEEAEFEIKNKTIIWTNGNFNAGKWHYGVWQFGNFKGIWENGIWENGNFEGTWKSGIGNPGK